MALKQSKTVDYLSSPTELIFLGYVSYTYSTCDTDGSLDFGSKNEGLKVGPARATPFLPSEGRDNIFRRTGLAS